MFWGDIKEARIQTMYISNKKRNIATGVNEQAFTNTSETNSGTVSFDNIIFNEMLNDNRKNDENIHHMDIRYLKSHIIY